MVSSRSVLCPVLIARSHDYDTLHQLLAEVKHKQRGQTVLISGEAGIGKSRLVTEVKADAAWRGISILQGNCFEPDYVLPYAPIIDLLRAFFSKLSSETIAQVSGVHARELVQLLPELAPILQYPDLTVSYEPEQEKRRCFFALENFFIQQAAHMPLILIVEDLHWSDDTSLEFLLQFTRRSTSYPIMLILTYRSDETQAHLDHFLATLDRERLAVEIPLNRLTASELNDMIRAIFNLQRPVRREFLDVVFTLTEGNPFYTEEILKSLITTGDIFESDDGWDRKPIADLHVPRSIQDSVRRRGERFSVEVQRILTLAAVVGQRFDFSLLPTLTGYSETDLLRAIKSLVDAQLVVEVSSGQFAFRHALTRQAIYTNLLKLERAVLHQDIAEAIEHQHSNSLDTYLAELAYHFYQAGKWERALQYCWRAGERARQLYALQSAIEYFTQALDAAHQLGITMPPSLLRARGLVYEARGDFEHARLDHESVLQITLSTKDRAVEWQALVDLGMLWASRDYTRTGPYYEQALLVAREVNDPILIAQSLNRLGNWQVNVGQAIQGLKAHHAALELFQAQGDRPGMAATFDLLGMATGISGDTVSAVNHYQQAISLFRELGDPAALGMSLASHIAFTEPAFTETTGRVPWSLAESEQELEEALSLARKVGSLANEAYVEWEIGVMYLVYGRLGPALRHAQRGLEIASEIEHRQWTTAACYSLGLIYSAMLMPEPAIQHLERALKSAHEIGSAWWIGNASAYLAMAYLLRGGFRHAEKLLDQTIQPDTMPENAPQRRLLWAWAELYLLSGNAQAALAIVERLVASMPGGATEQKIPILLMLQGQALVMLQRMDEAQQVLEAALYGALEREQTPLIWQIHLALGRLHQMMKHDDQARHEFTAAREVVQALASTIDDPALQEQFLNAAFEKMPREKPLSQRRVEAEKFGGLTLRERQVITHIAHGKSNREIADTLFLSERTVETHVSNVLSKLGFTSRAQIAAWAVEKGLAKSEPD